MINDKGSVTSLYRKLHLFDVEVPNGPVSQESRYTQGGVHTAVTHSPLGTLGLSICYDVRFPELYTHLAAKGAEVQLERRSHSIDILSVVLPLDFILSQIDVLFACCYPLRLLVLR